MHATWVLAFLGCMVLAADGACAQDPPKAEPQLTGRVIDETGKPIAGAALGMFTGLEFVDTARLLAKPSAVTAADGSYAIAAGKSFSYGSLVIAAAGRQSCALQVNDEQAKDGGVMGETLLMAGTRLQGRVRDEAGAPLQSVRVRVESSISDRYGWQVRLLAGAVSDAKGIIAVPGVPRTGLKMIAEADGYLTLSRLVAHDSPLDLSLQKIGMVRGKVVDAAGTPVQGVPVYGVTVETLDGLRQVASAADGTFAITVPSRGRFRLSGYEPVAPHRAFSSGLLHGPADDVVMSPVAASGPRAIEVTVVDATTKAPLPKYHLSQQGGPAGNLQLALFHHGTSRRPYEGKTTLTPQRQEGRQLVLVVDAPGHAFEVVPVPDDLDKPLEVALGPEAVLIGKVTDAETGKPLAGVAVRALPKGTSRGSGGSAKNAGPLSDADGNYRIGSLRAGEYGVQSHAEGRPPSDVFTTKVQTGTETRLDVTVPKEHWLDFELAGDVPAGPAYRLTLGSTGSSTQSNGFFQHSMTWPPPLAIKAPGPFRIGPVGDGTFSLQLWAPSRTRVGAGTTVQIGEVRSNAGKATITLPDLTMHLLQGRIELAQDVPSERIAVLATPPPGRRQMSEQRPTLAGIGTDGRFAIDLPTGSYCLQLADLLTGIVFHTEEADIVVNKDTAPPVLVPQYRWLEVDCRPERAGGLVVLQSFIVKLPRPRNGAHSAFVNWDGRTNNTETSNVEFHHGGESQRWLVPAGEIEIKANQSFEMLRPWTNSYRHVPVATAKASVSQPVQRVQLEIPGPPSDEELQPTRK